MRRRKHIVGLVALAVMAGGVLFLRPWFFAFANQREKATLGYAEGGGSSSAPATAVDVGAIPTVRPEVEQRDNFLRLTGSIEADQRSEVASTANGIVQEVRVERGSMVEKGDVLVVVDPRDAENMLAEGRAGVDELRAAMGWEDPQQPYEVTQHPAVRAAKAALDLAKVELDRHKALLAKGAIPQGLYDQVHTRYETTEQQYQQALYQAKQLYQSYKTALTRVAILEKAVADTTITAPFSGWIAEKYVTEGERVATGAGAKVVLLVKVDPLRLVLTVPQQYAALVKQGQQVKFTVETFPDKTFTGEVKHIAPSLESDSRSLSVEAMVANPDRTLMPGFFASAELTLPGKMERLVVPASAVVQVGEAARVFVIREGQVVEKVVELDETRGDRAYVKSGLTADDVVVTAPDTLAKTDGGGQ